MEGWLKAALCEVCVMVWVCVRAQAIPDQQSKGDEECDFRKQTVQTDKLSLYHVGKDWIGKQTPSL